MRVKDPWEEDEYHGFKKDESVLYEPVMHSCAIELSVMKDGLVPARVTGFTSTRVRIEIDLGNKKIVRRNVSRFSLKKRPATGPATGDTSIIDVATALTYNRKTLEEVESTDELFKKTLPTQGQVGHTVKVVQYLIYRRPRTKEHFRVRKSLN